MDKTLNRRILFDKKSGEVADIPEKKKKQPVPPKEAPKVPPAPQERPVRGNQSQKIVKWLKDHDLFKATAMAESIGIDRGNFSRLLNSENPTISDENQLKIISIIKRYGYAE